MKIPFRYLALIGLLIAVPVSAWAIAYRPMNSTVHITAEEIRFRTDTLSNFGEINRQHREMRSLKASLETAKENAIQRIPAKHNAEQWLESASDEAQMLGLIVKSVTTSGVHDDGEYLILPVDMNVIGKFSSVYKLIQHLEQMESLSRIERMTLHKIDGETVEARLIVRLICKSGESQ